MGSLVSASPNLLDIITQGHTGNYWKLCCSLVLRLKINTHLASKSVRSANKLLWHFHYKQFTESKPTIFYYLNSMGSSVHVQLTKFHIAALSWPLISFKYIIAAKTQIGIFLCWCQACIIFTAVDIPCLFTVVTSNRIMIH